MIFNSDLESIGRYLEETTNPFDDGLTLLDFLREQLSYTLDASEIRVTLQGILDMGNKDLVCTSELVEEIKKSLENEVWPPPSLIVVEGISKDTRISNDDNDDDDITAQNTFLLLECMEEFAESSTYSDTALYCALSYIIEHEACNQILNRSYVIQSAERILAAAAVTSAAANPCRFALSGKCLRASCTFDHSFQCIPCGYYLHSPTGCQKGDLCPFLHGEQMFTDQQVQVSDSNPSISVDSDDCSFPALPITANKECATIASSAVQQLESISEILLTKFSRPVRTSQAAAHTQDTKAQYSSTTLKVPSLISSHTTVISDWVEGGKGVRALYTDARSATGALARERNALFERSQSAFRAGRGSEARELSIQGRKVHEELLREQERACKIVFSARNSKDMLHSGKLDLHGLHALEAEECLYSLLPALSNKGLIEVTVFTGSGHHSQSGDKKGRLRAVVISVCDELKLPVQGLVEPGGGGHVGAFTVRVSSLRDRNT
jgi:DNA-nicking Smr family endonuclease